MDNTLNEIYFAICFEINVHFLERNTFQFLLHFRPNIRSFKFLTTKIDYYDIQCFICQLCHHYKHDHNNPPKKRARIFKKRADAVVDV